jgi:hypothetical protein
MNFSILIPTRLRDSRLPVLIENIYDTAKDKENIEILFCLEATDIASLTTLSKMTSFPNLKWFIHDSKSEHLIFPDLYNLLYKETSSDIILVAADDVKFHTPDWDSMVLDCFNIYDDKILLVNPRDGIQNGSQAPHFFIHRNWIDILGYVEPTHFFSEFQDTWVSTIAMKIGRYTYLPDFYLEHQHYTVGKRPLDLTNREKDIGKNRDRIAWGEKQGELLNDVEKLKKFIKYFNND